MASGKRVAARAPSSRARSPRSGFWILAAGVAAALLAWGLLVYAAIGFGAHGRAGDAWAWLYLALSSLGAVACLFAALLLIARLLGAVEQSDPDTDVGLLPPVTTPARPLPESRPDLTEPPDLELRPSTSYADELRRRIAALNMADPLDPPLTTPTTGALRSTTPIRPPVAPSPEYGPLPQPRPTEDPTASSHPEDEALPPGARPSGYRRRIDP